MTSLECGPQVSSKRIQRGSVPKSIWGPRAVTMPNALYSREIIEAHSRMRSGSNSAASSALELGRRLGCTVARIGGCVDWDSEGKGLAERLHRIVPAGGGRRVLQIHDKDVADAVGEHTTLLVGQIPGASA